MLKAATLIGIAAGAMVLAGPAWAVNAPIYKCLDNHLNLVYTDLPCKEGEVVDIRAGDADPAAVARLERERDQLDQSAAQRMSDERRAALSPAYPAWLPQEESAPDTLSSDYGYGGYGFGYLTYPPVRRPHHPQAHRPHTVRATVPATPHVPRS